MNSLAAKLSRFGRKALARSWLFAALVLVSQRIEEWYPLSHFPMYSGFAHVNFYIYVVDEHDEPIAMETDFGTRTAYLKKVYVRNLGAFSRKREKAVAATLDFLAERKRPSARAQSLTLKEGRITRHKERVDVVTRTLGTVEL